MCFTISKSDICEHHLGREYPCWFHIYKFPISSVLRFQKMMDISVTRVRYQWDFQLVGQFCGYIRCWPVDGKHQNIPMNVIFTNSRLTQEPSVVRFQKSDRSRRHPDSPALGWHAGLDTVVRVRFAYVSTRDWLQTHVTVAYTAPVRPMFSVFNPLSYDFKKKRNKSRCHQDSPSMGMKLIDYKFT